MHYLARLMLSMSPAIPTPLRGWHPICSPELILTVITGLSIQLRMCMQWRQRPGLPLHALSLPSHTPQQSQPGLYLFSSSLDPETSSTVRRLSSCTADGMIGSPEKQWSTDSASGNQCRFFAP
jgi:hypothetical protein